MHIREFFKYHNKHIRFRLNDGRILQGVLLDLWPKSGRTSSEYVFIPTNKMIDWKNADVIGDVDTKRQLEKNLIDISQIEWADYV